MNNLLMLMTSVIAANPTTGDTGFTWIIPVAAISLLLVVLLVIFGKKRPPSDD